MQELYRIKRGDTSVVCTDYSSEPIREIKINLDSRLSPSQNAQRYYKDYSKKNNAKELISKQISIAQEEAEYIESVLESLERAKSEADYSQIRTELAKSGYGKRGVAIKSIDKRKKAVVQTLNTPGGFKLYVGRNNTQNDHISFELADKEDLWFHVKDYPGAHVLLVSDGVEVPNEDKEFAARIAAGASGAGTADKVAVDYTLARYVKKPSGSRPGFVNYFKYTTVYVNPLKLDS
jgi:predicted ribosome quality control (RQC) complex YloA/Tae2 family protein